MSGSSDEEQQVQGCLEVLDNTLDKIKSFTRSSFQLNNPSKVVELWREELSRRLLLSQDPLPLVYCCNDVLQESRSELRTRYCEEFALVLEDEFQAILAEKPELKKQIERVVAIWASRHIFEKPYIKKLNRCLRGEPNE
jgi:hypothetical protein